MKQKSAQNRSNVINNNQDNIFNQIPILLNTLKPYRNQLLTAGAFYVAPVLTSMIVTQALYDNLGVTSAVTAMVLSGFFAGLLARIVYHMAIIENGNNDKQDMENYIYNIVGRLYQDCKDSINAIPKLIDMIVGTFGLSDEQKQQMSSVKDNIEDLIVLAANFIEKSINIEVAKEYLKDLQGKVSELSAEFLSNANKLQQYFSNPVKSEDKELPIVNYSQHSTEGFTQPQDQSDHRNKLYNLGGKQFQNQFSKNDSYTKSLEVSQNNQEGYHYNNYKY